MAAPAISVHEWLFRQCLCIEDGWSEQASIFKSRKNEDQDIFVQDLTPSQVKLDWLSMFAALPGAGCGAAVHFLVRFKNTTLDQPAIPAFLDGQSILQACSYTIIIHVFHT